MTTVYHADQLPLFPSDTKVCSTCKSEKPFDNFPRNKNTKDGYDPRCKACRTNYHAEYRAKHRPEPKLPVPISNPTSKICTECSKEKPLDDFYNMKQGRFGKQPRCKDCCAPKDRKIKRFPTPNQGYKFCHGCDQEKSIEEFNFLKSKGRHFAQCRECELAHRREQWNLRHPRKTPLIPKSTKAEHKICNTCLIEKPYAEFSPTSTQKDGYTGRCKKCRSDLYQSLPEEERERIRKQDNESRIPHIEKRRAYDRLRHNTEEHNAKRRKQIAYKNATDESFRNAVSQAQVEWRKNNPLYIRESNRRHKIKQNAARSGERISYKRILERDGAWCYICECAIDLTITDGPASLVFDHQIPLHPRKGELKGTHTANNIHPAHKLCNERKLNKQFESLSDFDRRGVD